MKARCSNSSSSMDAASENNSPKPVIAAIICAGDHRDRRPDTPVIIVTGVHTNRMARSLTGPLILRVRAEGFVLSGFFVSGTATSVQTAFHLVGRGVPSFREFSRNCVCSTQEEVAPLNSPISASSA